MFIHYYYYYYYYISSSSSSSRSGSTSSSSDSRVTFCVILFVFVLSIVITHWNPNDPKSHVLGGFYYNNAGALTVPFTGRYYVYAQLMFPAKPSPSKNRVLVMAGNRILLMINKDLPGGPVELTGSAGGVFVLSAGEQITVKPIEYNTALWFDPYHCYFGAYLVSV